MVRHRETGKDFSRDRRLTFIILIIFLLNLLKRSQQDELDEFLVPIRLVGDWQEYSQSER